MAEIWQHWEGRRIDRFPLLQYLGGSDHSVVFLTERAGQPREAAIKLNLKNQRTPELQVPWWENIAKLRHAHLIQLFEAGLCRMDGVELPYCLMEYAEENLAQILPHRPLTPEEVWPLLKSVVDVLGYLHSQGLVHGHIKPANILAVGDQIKLSSDGLCEMDRTTKMKPHDIHDAPEIANGAVISSHSDVWSVGILLVEALIQRPPVWNEAGQGEAIVPQTLPAPFVDVASHCLRRDPQARWTVAQIAGRLDKNPVPAQGQGLLGKMLAKRAYLFPTLAGATVLLAIATGAWLLDRQRDTRYPAASPAQLSKGESGAARSPAPSSTPQKVAALSSSPETPAPTRGFIPGAVVEQSLPQVPRRAANTIQGKVRVKLRLTVDASGNVVAAELESRGPSQYFADLALKAAHQWKFTPARIDGREVPSQWVLRFEFGRAATQVYPAAMRP